MPHLLFQIQNGSRLHQTHTKKSDYDSIQIIFPTLDELLNNTLKNTHTIANNEDTKKRTLNTFLNGIEHNASVDLDLLFAPQDNHLVDSPHHDILKILREHYPTLHSQNYGRLLGQINLGTKTYLRLEHEKTINLLNEAIHVLHLLPADTTCASGLEKLKEEFSEVITLSHHDNIITVTLKNLGLRHLHAGSKIDSAIQAFEGLERKLNRSLHQEHQTSSRKALLSSLLLCNQLEDLVATQRLRFPVKDVERIRAYKNTPPNDETCLAIAHEIEERIAALHLDTITKKEPDNTKLFSHIRHTLFQRLNT